MDSTKTAEQAQTVVVDANRLKEAIWEVNHLIDSIADLDSIAQQLYYELTEMRDGNIR